ncbi:MAG TPA: amidase family protein, partial [Byssovorax sp.]
MIDVLARPVTEIAALVQRGEVSALEVADASLARIAAHNAEFGAFLTVQADEARAAAKAIDAKRARGERLGPLAGVPVGLKDAITVRDAPTTAGSLALTRAPRAGEPARDPARGFRSPYDATVVERLRAADAVLPGKCNLDEFAMGSSTENSAFYPAKNPWDPTRAPGGSSGGSAVAVSLAMTPASLGSDTGGSIRQPAALCGVVGVKPTYGRVSRSGLVAFASSLDQIGPFAADVRSAARVLDTIAGHDPRDATSVAGAPLGCEAACGRDIKGMRLGVPAEYFVDGIDPRVDASVRAAIAALEAAGCTLVPVELPHTRYAVATYYVIVTAECSSNLARYDGVRYGLRVDGADVSEMNSRTRDAGFGIEVKRRIML